jgi:hypothetical protein
MPGERLFLLARKKEGEEYYVYGEHTSNNCKLCSPKDGIEIKIRDFQFLF